jgi:hypothetical protein
MRVDHSRGDSDGASSFLNRMPGLLEKMPDIMSNDTKLILLEAAEKMLTHKIFTMLRLGFMETS